MSNNTKYISLTQLMDFIKETYEGFNDAKHVWVYFNREKAYIRTTKQNGFDRMTRLERTVYFKPIRIILDKKPKEQFDLDILKEEFKNYVVFFKCNRHRQINTIHTINMIELNTQQMSLNGMNYYPSETVLYSKQKLLLNKLQEESKDDEPFTFKHQTNDFKESDDGDESDENEYANL